MTIPASRVGLEGVTVSGMAFTLFDGRATWDPAGATANGDGGDTWNWVSSNPSPNTGQYASQSAIASGEHQHFFLNATATLSVATGDVLYAYIYIDPNNLPSEAMLQWYDGSGWEHRAYWGANSVPWGTGGTVSRQNMGPLPAAGQWVKLSVPASQVGLEGATVTGMAFTLYGGRATWDTAGRVSGPGSVTGGGATISVNTTAEASRTALQPGAFTVSRSGSTNFAMTVNYTLSGTATSGADYFAPGSGLSPPTLSIPAGASSATVTITPLPTTNIVGAQTVVLNLLTNSNYSIGTPNSATLSLAGNSVRPISFQVGSLGATLVWPSVSNAVYQIACKTNLTDPTWTPISGQLTTQGLSNSWSDTSASKTKQKFYIITRVQ